MINSGSFDTVTAFKDITFYWKQLSVFFIKIFSTVNVLGTGAIVTPDTFN